MPQPRRYALAMVAVMAGFHTFGGTDFFEHLLGVVLNHSTSGL